MLRYQRAAFDDRRAIMEAESDEIEAQGPGRGTTQG